MKQSLIYITFITGLISQDGIEELDLDALWENTVWEEIAEVTTKEFEVEKVTDVAGVRGAEAEDEALHHLYYRQSMKGPSEIELNKALGKLKNTLAALKEKNSEHEKIPEVTHYIIQIYKKLNEPEKADSMAKELLATAPDSKYTKFYK